jgi:glycosyltransferase involved in cell wall biosynthesis
LYNIKYRVTILFFSLFKRRFYHHTISYHAKKYLEHFYDPNQVIHIIHGVDLKAFQDTQDNAIKNEKMLNFLYVGNLDDEHKGVGVLLNAIEKFLDRKEGSKLYFEFCGMGPLESELLKLQKKFPKYLKYHGYVNNDKIPQYYKKNDVLLFPSRREPFGRVIIEALASKLIILCNKTYGTVEILSGKEFSFFFRDLSSDAIIEKIYEIHQLWKMDINKFRELRKAAKEYAFQNYDLSREVEIFKKLIADIFKNRSK